MQEILLIETDEKKKGGTSLASFIEAAGQYSVVRMNLQEALETGFEDQRRFSATVLNCHFLNTTEFAAVQKLSRTTPNLPILVAARQIALESYRKIDSLHNTVAIQKEFQPEVFTELLERMSKGDGYKPVVSPRFLTDAEVRVMVLDSGLIIRSRMRNYSSSGLFIEYRGISLKVGDIVRVSVPCPDATETRASLNLKARVVWERKFGMRSPARGVGLQFI
jgi:hypothetical protein